MTTSLMSSIAEQMVERLAQALSREDDDGWKRLCEELPQTADDYRDDARTALEASELTRLSARLAEVERERDEARKYCSAAADDYTNLIALLERAYDASEPKLPFDDAFREAAKECRETSEFMRLAAEGRANGTIYDDELTKEKAARESSEAKLAKAREALEACPLPSTMGNVQTHYQQFYDWYEQSVVPVITEGADHERS